MAEKKSEPQPRTFVKKDRDGNVVKTRQITSPSAEVAARFDGFTEETTTAKSKSAAESKPAAGSPS